LEGLKNILIKEKGLKKSKKSKKKNRRLKSEKEKGGEDIWRDSSKDQNDEGTKRGGLN